MPSPLNQTIELPSSYHKYLSYTHMSKSYLEEANFISRANRRLFPGIEITKQNQENIIVSINGEKLPHYGKSVQKQTVILNALKVLESISKLPADKIESEDQDQMADSIRVALDRYLRLGSSGSSKASPETIAFLSLRALAISLMIAAYLVLLFPVAPIAVAVSFSIIFGSVIALLAGLVVRDIKQIVARVSDSRQTKMACNNLADTITKANEKIARLSSNASADVTDIRKVSDAIPMPPPASANKPVTSELSTPLSGFFHLKEAAANHPVGEERAPSANKPYLC